MTNIQPTMDHFERPDPAVTSKIITHLKSQGIFDQFRRECMADVDTKPAYLNLRQRVENSVAAFLQANPWRSDMNKNQLRDNLRKHVQSGGFLDIGVDRIVDQVVNPKVYTVLLPKVEEAVQTCLGMNKDEPKFEPPSVTDVKSEPAKFQDKHNLAPRAKLPAPLMGPIMNLVKPSDQEKGRSSPKKEPMDIDNDADTDTEEATDKKYVVDEDEEEKEEDEDDEESPPFEPHSEGDRMILGMRSDSSEHSEDSQVVTTIVDDSLEERIDNNETIIKEEENDKKDDDSSSDEYVVPKTPTINMEESDGTVVEFNSISEYKQYQTKFETDSLENVEEVVLSQCVDDTHNPIKRRRGSSDDRVEKRHAVMMRRIPESSSDSDKDSSDEIKPAVFESFAKKRFKMEEYENENSRSEFSVNDAENEDSYTEKSLDMSDSKMKISDTEDMSDSKIKISDNEHYEKTKGSSSSSKDSGKTHSSHNKDHRERTSHHSFKDKTAEKEPHETSKSSHSSKDKKDIHMKSERHESSRDRHKESDRKRSESSSIHSGKDTRRKHHDKDKEKKRSKSSEKSKRDKDDTEKSRKESRHDHKDHHHERKSRDYHDKEKKKNHDKHSEGTDHESSHRGDKDKSNDSKHNHSSRHSHRSSSEKHKSDRENKLKGSSERHKSRDKKSDKDNKDESRKKYRQHCKYTDDQDENRRSSDRDSSGPSCKTYLSGSSKSTSSRSFTESKGEAGERTTSNSDNTVSDSIEALHDASNDQIVSLNFQVVESVSDSSNHMESDCNSTKEEQEHQSFDTKYFHDDNTNKAQCDSLKRSENTEESLGIVNASGFQFQSSISGYQTDSKTSQLKDSYEINTTDEEENNDKKQDIPSASLHDSSSEKENIEQIPKEQFSDELRIKDVNTSLGENSASVVKFKKPKIAKNIHEVKRIMEARRYIKRMEKKRMKLHVRNNSGDSSGESDEKSSSEDKQEDESEEDVFRGFEDDFASEKIQNYDSLTKRLEKEVLQLEQLINHEQITTNITTSLISLNPDLDSYIENTLKGKVHRRYRVRLPPISDEYYNYDSEQNVYTLVKNLDEQSEVKVDSNLNNLNSVDTTDLQETMMNCDESTSKRSRVGDSINSVTQPGCHYIDLTSPKPKIGYVIESDDEAVEIDEENVASSNTSTRKTITDVGKTTDSIGVIPTIIGKFSITFNQTYDEVLKEKAQNSVVSSRREAEEARKTPLTVVKITNNKSSEQVLMKKFQSNLEDEDQVPRMKSETIINGKIMEESSVPKKVPLISRIAKGKMVLTPSITKVKSRCANGATNPDSTFEEVYSKTASQRVINDIIGIHDAAFDQGSTSDRSSQSGEECSGRTRRRKTGSRAQQRYDSTDLYKPRIQLSSRRTKAVSSSPEEIPQAIATRKRSATTDLVNATSKRRR